jgi:SPP1 gp7 family putative phage head morphogenesis protein
MPLTQRQINNLARRLARQKQKFKGYKSPEPSQAIEAQYMMDMRRLTEEVYRMIEAEVIPVLEEYESSYAAPETQDALGPDLSMAFSAIELQLRKQENSLNKYAEGIAQKSFSQWNRSHRRKWVAQINKIAGVNISNVMNDLPTQAALLDKVDENVKLIKTLQPEYLKDVEEAVKEGLTRGDDFFSIRERLEQLHSTHSKYRPKLIARDQMSKFTGELNKLRQEDLGIKEYVWRTSKDGAVRDSHRANDRKTFSWASPPAETGHPGEDINCRCIADPVFEGFIERVRQQRSWEPDDPKVLELKEE